jgi:hypothetical protein
LVYSTGTDGSTAHNDTWAIDVDTPLIPAYAFTIDLSSAGVRRGQLSDLTLNAIAGATSDGSPGAIVRAWRAGVPMTPAGAWVQSTPNGQAANFTLVASGALQLSAAAIAGTQTVAQSAQSLAPGGVIRAQVVPLTAASASASTSLDYIEAQVWYTNP